MTTIYGDQTPRVAEKAAAYQLLPEDNGKVFLQTADDVTWTLPLVANLWDGWHVEIYNIGATQMVITGESGKLIGFDNAAATTATCALAGEIIGTAVKVMYADCVDQFMVFLYNSNGATDSAMTMS